MSEPLDTDDAVARIMSTTGHPHRVAAYIVRDLADGVSPAINVIGFGLSYPSARVTAVGS